MEMNLAVFFYSRNDLISVYRLSFECNNNNVAKQQSSKSYDMVEFVMETGLLVISSMCLIPAFPLKCNWFRIQATSAETKQNKTKVH